jgi:hypothetical protein
MKRNNLFVFSLFGLVLCSCGSTQYAATPNGKEISNEVGKTKMQQSMQASDDKVRNDEGKLKIGIEDGYLKADCSSSYTSIFSSDLTKGEISIDISKFKALFSAEGINSDDADDFHSHLEFSLHGGMGMSSTIGSVTTNKNIENRNYDADVYQDCRYTYFDVSSTDTLALLQKFFPKLDFHGGKMKINTTVNAIDEDMNVYIKNPADQVDFSFENLVEADEGGTYLDLGNGNYAFSYTFDKDGLSTKLNTTYASDRGMTFTLSEDSSLKYTILFSETDGITSIGFDAKIGGSYKYTDESESQGVVVYTSSNNIDFSISMGTKLTFDTSSSVNVDKISDTTQYEELTGLQNVD